MLSPIVGSVTTNFYFPIVLPQTHSYIVFISASREADLNPFLLQTYLNLEKWHLILCPFGYNPLVGTQKYSKNDVYLSEKVLHL